MAVTSRLGRLGVTFGVLLLPILGWVVAPELFVLGQEGAVVVHEVGQVLKIGREGFRNGVTRAGDTIALTFELVLRPADDRPDPTHDIESRIIRAASPFDVNQVIVRAHERRRNGLAGLLPPVGGRSGHFERGDDFRDRIGGDAVLRGDLRRERRQVGGTRSGVLFDTFLPQLANRLFRPLFVLQLVKFPKKLRVLHHTANVHREVDYSK